MTSYIGGAIVIYLIPFLIYSRGLIAQCAQRFERLELLEHAALKAYTRSRPLSVIWA